MKNSLKSIIAALLCLCLICTLVLTGCSKSGSNNDEQVEDNTEEPTKTNKAAAVEGVTLDKSTLSLVPGQQATLRAVVSPTNAISKLVIWSSTNEAVATVNEEGVVTAVSEGTAVIVATTVNGKTFLCNVTVAICKVFPTEMSLDKDKLEFFNGESESLTVTFDPADTTEQEIIWTSSAPDVAAVANGMITAIGAGSATITATASNGISVSCDVDVLGEKIFYVSDGAITGLTDYGKTFTQLSVPAVIKGEKITSIKPRVFGDCNYLTSITLTMGLETVEKNAFLDCEYLEAIYYDGDIANWCKIDFADATAHPLHYVDKLYLRNSSGQYKLMDTELVIPDTATKIGSYSFYKCASLKSVTLPKSIEKIGKNAFYNCSSFEAVYYDGGIADWCKIDFADATAHPLHYVDKLYLKNSSGQYGFMDTELIIPDNVTRIGSYSFYNCASLKSITLPKSIEKIGKHAFYNCSSLDAVYYGGDIADWCHIEFADHRGNPLYSAHDLFLKNQSGEYDLVTEIVIPDTVTEIKAYTFFFSSASSIRLPEGIVKIGDWAFAYCRSLRSVTLPDGLKSITNSAFANCNALETVTLPTSIEKIAAGAFSGCSALKEIKYRGSEAQWAAIANKAGLSEVLSGLTVIYNYTGE